MYDCLKDRDAVQHNPRALASAHWLCECHAAATELLNASLQSPEPDLANLRLAFFQLPPQFQFYYIAPASASQGMVHAVRR